MEPKFRVWDKDEQQMYYQGSNVDRDNGVTECFIAFDGMGASAWIKVWGDEDYRMVKNFDLMPFVPFIDAYIGDIIEFEMPGFCSGDYISVVLWDEKRDRWKFDSHTPSNILNGCRDFRVIGNRFENPDLLRRI